MWVKCLEFLHKVILRRFNTRRFYVLENTDSKKCECTHVQNTTPRPGACAVEVPLLQTGDLRHVQAEGLEGGESPCDSEWGPASTGLQTLVPAWGTVPCPGSSRPGRLAVLAAWSCTMSSPLGRCLSDPTETPASPERWSHGETGKHAENSTLAPCRRGQVVSSV